MAVLSAIWKFVKAIGSKISVQIGKDNVSAQTGDGSSVEQTVVGDVRAEGGSQVVIAPQQGLTPKQMDEPVARTPRRAFGR